MNDKILPFYSWTYFADGTMETDVPPSPKLPPSTEPLPLHDIDKLIEESTGLYRMWWIMYKQEYPERCLIREKEIEPPRPKIPAKIPFKPLTCKRCKHEWTPRSKEPPVSCPKCHSPYWNRERKKS